MFANEFEDSNIAGDDMTIKRLEDMIRDCNCQIEEITRESNVETHRMRLHNEVEIDY